jgi:hypothetical protein
MLVHVVVVVEGMEIDVGEANETFVRPGRMKNSIAVKEPTFSGG